MSPTYDGLIEDILTSHSCKSDTHSLETIVQILKFVLFPYTYKQMILSQGDQWNFKKSYELMDLIIFVVFQTIAIISLLILK